MIRGACSNRVHRTGPRATISDVNRRLAFVVTEDWWLWSYWLGLVKAARDAGYDVTVVTRVGRYGDRIRALGFDLVDIDFGRGRLSPRINLRTLYRLQAVYRRLRPHLVHHVALQPAVLGSAAAALRGGSAVVNTIAGMGHVLASNHLHTRLLGYVLFPALGWALRRSHAIVQNPDDAAFVRSLGARPDRIAVVRGAGVDIRRFSPSPEPAGPVRVAMVSRLLWAKGVREFVEAARIIRSSRSDVVFTLVGAPDEDNPGAVPSRQAAQWMDAGLIDWWGYREDIPEVWARSHIAALPSWYREGLPSSLLEAAACARPIVTTDMPGCREAVRDGENGLLVPPRDAGALADAIMTLVDAPARREAMGVAGRRRAETEFAASRIHEETLRIYERALAER